MKFESLPLFTGTEAHLLDLVNPVPDHLTSKVEPGTLMQPSELLSCARPASEINELADLKGIGQRIIHCVNAPNLSGAGVHFRADDTPVLEELGLAALVALNPNSIGTNVPLDELYLRKVAHLICGSEYHDWKYAAVFNALCMSNGLGLTQEDDDYRDGLLFMPCSQPQPSHENVLAAKELAQFVGAKLTAQPDWSTGLEGRLEMLEFSLEGTFSDDPLDLEKIKAECVKVLGL